MVPYNRFMLNNIFGVRGAKIRELSRLLSDRKLKLNTIDKCALCNKNHFLLIAKYDRYGLPVDQLICQYCSLIQTAKFFDDCGISEFYNKHYRILQSGKKEQVEFEKRFSRQVCKGEVVLKNIESCCGNVENKSFAEIGCGAGGIVHSLINSGIDAVGYDIDPTLLKFGKKMYNLPLYQVQFGMDSQEYDVIILRHVLEHIPNTNNILQAIYKSLKTDGILYIEVPGVRSILSGKYNYNLMKFFVIEHIYTFELKTLAPLVERHGFKLISGSEDIVAIFQKCEDIPKLNNSYTSANKIIQEFVNVERIFKKKYFLNIIVTMVTFPIKISLYLVRKIRKSV